jgi:RHS repeat-associated protein
LNRLQQVTDPAALVASQAYDVNGNRTSMTNPASAATSFAYDDGGRVTSTTTAGGKVTAQTYNSRGLPYVTTEPSTQTTTLTYDDAQRLSSTADAVGTISLTRDADGRVLTITEGSKVLTRVYDALGRLTSYTDGDGNVIGYQYDDIGRLATLTYPDSKQVTYAYDTAGRLHTVTDWASRTTTYTYDAVGRMTQLLRPNGTKQTRSYDDAGQLLHLKEYASNGTTVFYASDCSYDAAGQLSAETVDPAIAVATLSVAQTFDVDNRLATHASATTTFDADGNLTAISSGVSPASYTYDARNRLTIAGSLSYTYNAENRRTAVTNGSETTLYAINPNAALDQVLVRTLHDGTKTFYVYGVGLLHEQTGSSTPKYYHHDRRGDTVMMTDSSGAVTDRMAYGIYGEILSRTGSTDTPFLFNGKWGVQTDTNGLSFHRARYYHPVLRRFLNQDTILGSIEIIASMNRFVYANGNPVSAIDPFGLTAGEVDSLTFGQELSRFGRNVAYALDPLTFLKTVGWFTDELIRGGGMLADKIVPGSSGDVERVLLVASTIEGPGELRLLKNFAAENAMARGIASEARVLQEMGLAKNTTAVVTAEGRSIPDALTRNLSVEVKDSAYVSLTRQLRIQTQAAADAGRQSVLITGKNTKISRAAQNAFDQIIRRADLGK